MAWRRFQKWCGRSAITAVGARERRCRLTRSRWRGGACQLCASAPRCPSCSRIFVAACGNIALVNETENARARAWVFSIFGKYRRRGDKALRFMPFYPGPGRGRATASQSIRILFVLEGRRGGSTISRPGSFELPEKCTRRCPLTRRCVGVGPQRQAEIRRLARGSCLACVQERRDDLRESPSLKKSRVVDRARRQGDLQRPVFLKFTRRHNSRMK